MSEGWLRWRAVSWLPRPTVSCLPWLVALALCVLGWWAVAPVWTQGLGAVAFDGAGQPAMWFAAAEAAILLGGGAFVRDAFGLYSGGLESLSLRAQSVPLGTGMFTASAVLFMTMAGQPLRVWFLIWHVQWGNPLTQAVASFLVCYAALLLCDSRSRILSRAISWVGLLAYLVLTERTCPPTGAFLGLSASASLVWFLSGAASPTWPRRLGALIPVLLVLFVAVRPFSQGVRVSGSSPQEWLALAFALGCGAFAAWLRSRGLGASGRPGAL